MSVRTSLTRKSKGLISADTSTTSETCLCQNMYLRIICTCDRGVVGTPASILMNWVQYISLESGFDSQRLHYIVRYAIFLLPPKSNPQVLGSRGKGLFWESETITKCLMSQPIYLVVFEASHPHSWTVTYYEFEGIHKAENCRKSGV
jgi:hypothetical protein